jgi:hypothetical protein
MARRLAAAAAVLIGVLGASRPSCAQGVTVATSQNAQIQNGGVIRSPQDLNFNTLMTAGDRLTYKVNQVRRFRTEQGRLVGIREQVIVTGNGTRHPPFRLSFLGMEGAPPSAEEAAHWTDLYRNYSSLFEEHGSFRIYDAARAAQNYAIYPVAPALRAGRPVVRAVVLPRQLDKAIWLIDVDLATGLVLYAGEYDASARLLGELEVTSLLLGNLVGPLANNWAWRPRMQVTRFPTLQDTISQMLQVGGMDAYPPIAPNLTALPEYGLIESQISVDPLNAAVSMVLTYTDGIDAFFVIQSPNQRDPFAGIPSTIAQPGQKQPHTIAYYDDPSMRVYLFHHRDVFFTVAGRGALARLGEAARSVYRQAIRQ